VVGEQFTDEPPAFRSRARPHRSRQSVVLHGVYHSYLIRGLGPARSMRARRTRKAGQIEKDADGRPTGVVRGAGGVAFVAARVPLQTQERGSRIRASSELSQFDRLTAWLDAGGRAWEPSIRPYRYLADRVSSTSACCGRRSGSPRRRAGRCVIGESASSSRSRARPFRNVGWGERLAPLTISYCASRHTRPRPRQMHRFAALAARLFNSHVEMSQQSRPPQRIRGCQQGAPDQGLRWSSRISTSQRGTTRTYEKARMTAQIHSPVIQGALMHKVHGDKAWTCRRSAASRTGSIGARLRRHAVRPRIPSTHSVCSDRPMIGGGR